MKNKKMVLAVVALVVVIGLMMGVYFATRPETMEGAKGYTVAVIHSDGQQKEFQLRTDAEYLGEALLEAELIAGEDGPYGLTVITVDGEDAVWDTDNAYWCIWIGEEMATVGISDIPVYDGSVFTLEYTTFG